jgi:hypothetical protein
MKDEITTPKNLVVNVLNFVISLDYIELRLELLQHYSNFIANKLP